MQTNPRNMSANSSRYTGTPRTNMPVFGTYNGSQASLRLEKSNPGLRRSTPDSEALASSDEELEHSRLRNQGGSKASINPARRTFSLADHPSINRKPSMTASGTYSPTASNPTTPAADQNLWPTMSPSSTTWAGGSSGYPWTGNIWTTDSRKEPPTRLQEVHPGEKSNGIPFSIPLQPTIKTIRSQSYSFGQLDPAASQPHSGTANTTSDAGRTRTIGANPTLQRRTSRPGMLGGSEVNSLGRLREVDDDEETLDVTQRNVDQAREIERLEMENARLRAEQRQRTMSSTATVHTAQSFRNMQIRGAVPEESDQAIDDHDDVPAMGSYPFRNPPGRRFSEQLANQPDRQPLLPADNRLSRWQSAGFGRLSDIPQSRRHSFAADVPTRHGSFGSQDAEDPSLFENSPHGFTNIDDPVYFKLDEKRRLEAEASVQQGLTYAGPYGLVSFGGPGQTFVIVNFKCCRSDIFYIQEGTGLHIQIGDLVIVDADRGTDLGAVQHVNVTLEEARRYKDYYAEEHYKLLMMFSQQTKNGGMNAVNPNGPPSRQSTVGGMGPQGHGHRDGHGDPKAKMIKRLAQAHEIQALKEKEGNEAKAKRVCSSKVIEHGLNMEILDAEFQMDQKKLTFYYFADEYINFNALVTDLFKIYKTRIWMSAINPASFQTPTSSLGLTPAYSNTGIGGSITDPSRRSAYGSPGNVLHTQFDDPRNDPRSRGGIAAPYYQTYQPQAGMGQRLANTMANFPQGVQPALDPFASYSTQNFGMFGQATPNFGMNRPDPRGANVGQAGSQNWISQFQGLSMGS